MSETKNKSVNQAQPQQDEKLTNQVQPQQNEKTTAPKQNAGSLPAEKPIKGPAAQQNKTLQNQNLNKDMAAYRINPGDGRVLDNVTKNLLDPSLAAASREKLSKSEAVTSMCHVIENAPEMTTDEKLERLRSVNEVEMDNKEQAHRMAAEFTWQDGLLTFLIGGLFIGLSWLAGSNTKAPRNMQ